MCGCKSNNDAKNGVKKQPRGAYKHVYKHTITAKARKITYNTKYHYV